MLDLLETHFEQTSHHVYDSGGDMCRLIEVELGLYREPLVNGEVCPIVYQCEACGAFVVNHDDMRYLRMQCGSSHALS